MTLLLEQNWTEIAVDSLERPPTGSLSELGGSIGDASLQGLATAKPFINFCFFLKRHLRSGEFGPFRLHARENGLRRGRSSNHPSLTRYWLSK